MRHQGLAAVAEEGLDIGGELRVVLKQVPVRGLASRYE
jgi:hypothetical protein